MARQRKKVPKALQKSRILTVMLFTAVMIFFTLLGLVWLLRPSVSETENRKLAEFPTFSVSGVLDGSFFSGVSEWYSDTYPLRDTWMAGNDAMKGLYGIRTTRVIQGNSAKDDIPDVLDLNEPSETLPASPETAGALPESTQTEAETIREPRTEEAPPVTEAPVTVPAAENPPEAIPQTTVAEQQQEPVQPASDTLPLITAQAQNGLYVSGDSAFGIYYFNQNAAKIYVSVVNRTAAQLQGLSNVYCLLAPISSTFYLSPETLASTDGSDEVKALNTYYNSLDPLVKQVRVYDVLKEHRAEYIYFRTDHHWTNLGAYYAYRQFAQVKGITPHDISEYEVMEFPGFLGQYYVFCKAPEMEQNPDTVVAHIPLTYNRMTYEATDGRAVSWPIVNDVTEYRNSQKYSAFAAGDNPFSYIENPNVTNGQSCVLIKESYADSLIPYLTDHYQYIYWFDYRYYADTHGRIMDFIRSHNITDVLFVNGTDPISSLEAMERLDSLMQ